MIPQTTAQIDSQWKDSPRWKGIARGYQAADVVRLRGSVHVEHSLVEPDVELLLRRDAAVILDRFFAGRLIALDGKWIAADFNQIWRREKLHPRGIADDGVDQASLFNDQRLKTFALDLDAAGQTNRSGPHHDCVVH